PHLGGRPFPGRLLAPPMGLPGIWLHVFNLPKSCCRQNLPGFSSPPLPRGPLGVKYSPTVAALPPAWGRGIADGAVLSVTTGSIGISSTIEPIEVAGHCIFGLRYWIANRLLNAPVARPPGGDGICCGSWWWFALCSVRPSRRPRRPQV